MALHKISIFSKGVHNVLNDEQIPPEALQDEKNWLSSEGVLRLANGKIIIGTEGAAGKVRGLHFGYKVNGEKICFRKISGFIQYWNGTIWVNVTAWDGTPLTGIGATDEYSFANYSSLAGNFVFVSGDAGLFKINTANPGVCNSLYVAGTNDKGRIMIDKGRLIMWNCSDAAKTVIKMSHIDDQSATVYHDVTDNGIKPIGSQHITGTLPSASALRTCFGVEFHATVAAGVETFVDQKDGTLVSNFAGTGTINYTTGDYDVTFSDITTSAVDAEYTWENSNVDGLTDFTYTAVRVPSEGNMINQTIGGDAIEAVMIGQDGAYYSLKAQSAYRLEISADDKTFTNLVYRADMGIPFFRASVSTKKGIVFMNTANPDSPELTILQRDIYSGNVEPLILFPHFDFSNYGYDDACIDTFGQYVVIACQSSDSDFNDTVLLCDIAMGTVDIGYYPARIFAKDAGNLYTASPITESVYNIFSGFDDDNFTIENYATLKGEIFGIENLKKFRKLKIQGQIEKDQTVEIYVSYDLNDFELIGTIDGNADYVDSGSPRVVGSNMVGTVPIGGDNAATVYSFFYELKTATPKFRKVTLKFIATAMGYIDLNSIIFDDILIFENRIPKRFRVKPP